jgi:hypothetical protein
MASLAGPAAAACSDVLRLDRDPAIRVEDLARIGSEDSKDAGDNYLLRISVFRPSERPEREGWSALAIILATEKGLGVEPLGGVLWTRRPDQFDDKPLSLTATAKTARATATPRASLAGCPQAFVIEIDAKGVVTLDGARWKQLTP